MSKIENGVQLSMIWAVDEPGSDGAWLIDCWDEFSIDGNYDGWLEAVKKAEAEHPVTRITTTVVDYAAVQQAFQPTAINNNGIKEN